MSARSDSIAGFRRGLALALALALSATPALTGSRAQARRGSSAAVAGSGPATWDPWLLQSADQYRLPAPPSDESRRTRRELRELRQLQEERTPKVRRRIARWNKGPATAPWERVMLDMIVDWRPRPAFSARGLALLHNALLDALIAAKDSKGAYDRPAPATLDERIRPTLVARGSTYPPVQSVIAGAAEEVLGYLFPNEPDETFERMARRAAESRLYAGVNYRTDIERGLALGRQVGLLFLERAANDGSDSTGPAHPQPEGEAYWSPTPPGFEPSIGGPVGKWTPWLMSSPNEARVTSGIPGPFTYGSPEFMAELQEVIDVDTNLTGEQESIAYFWDDGPATYTPPGHWTDIALDLVDSHRLGTAETALLMSALGSAQADAAIAFFEAKYFWWSIRPITAIRRLCEGASRLCTEAELEADPALATYPDWYSIIVTPPFPSYPGGHSTFSGSAAAVIAHFVPEAAELLTARGEEAAMSRLYGGIHFRSDNDAGLVLGRTIAQLAIERVDQIRN